jgi:predicted DNA-binding transcriptional regulator YafY
MNRIDRISAILIQLQSRRTVKAGDIASRFNISLRTVYRDVKTLEEAGIPIIGEAGIGYSLVDGYRLPPVMFTRDEASAFLTAEKLVAQLTDDANGASYSSAMYKIKAVLKSVDKDYLEVIDNHIEVLRSRNHRELKEDVNPLQTILQAIAEKKILSIRYTAAYKQTPTSREIEPVGVFYLDNHWHLIAYCKLRNDYRDFRFDRLDHIAVTGESFVKVHPPLKEHLKSLYKANDLITIVIRIKKDMAPYMSEQRYYHGYVSETIDGDIVEMQFLTPYLEGFSRWYITFADQCIIVEPPALKEKIRGMLEKISNNL